MRLLIFLLILSFLSACNSTSEPPIIDSLPIAQTPKEIQQTTLQTILDEAKIKGAILVFDPQTNNYYSNNFNWAKLGRLPASTFKIPNSIIGLETGVVEDENTLFKWDGEPKFIKTWEQDLVFKDAFRYSCVPCYQEMARNIGAERMNEYLTKLNYGHRTINPSTIDMFWLEGDYKVSQFEQIDFLQRFYNSKLPIQKRTEEMVKNFMIIDQNNAYTLSGKTGWMMAEHKNNGWFVGYVEKNDKVYYFATNIDPTEEFDMADFPKIRAQVTKAGLQELGIIE